MTFKVFSRLGNLKHLGFPGHLKEFCEMIKKTILINIYIYIYIFFFFKSSPIMLMRLGTKKDNKITHPASVVHLGRKIANLRVWISGSLKFPEIILVNSLSRF